MPTALSLVPRALRPARGPVIAVYTYTTAEPTDGLLSSSSARNVFLTLLHMTL